MEFINQEDLENFMNKFVEEGNEQPQQFCESAMEAVRDYLNYDPEEQEYSQTIRGDGGELLPLKACHITNIISYEVDGVSHSVDELEITEENENYIQKADGSCFDAGVKYSISYKAGWDEVPAIIKTTALQVASLFWESAGGNLAVSSTTFADTGSRVFNNYKMDRFLEQIAKYKRVF